MFMENGTTWVFYPGRPTKIILPKYGKKKRGRKTRLTAERSFYPYYRVTFIVPPSHHGNTYIPPPPFLNWLLKIIYNLRFSF